MNQKEFLEEIRKVANSETSFDPNGWTNKNTLWGHCAVVSLLAQDIFGGEIIKGSLLNHPKYEYVKSHFWNRIDGSDVDFTAEQYNDLSYKDLKGETYPRELILSYLDTVKRFDLLKQRFNGVKI
jgi:hypothetical protein